MQTLRAGCSKADLISYRPSFMKIDASIPSYRGNRPTNKQTHKRTHKQTGPITIHCAVKLLARSVKDVCNRWKGKKAIPHIIQMNFLAN